MISVKIEEIDNGFLLKVFGIHCGAKTIFCESFEKVLEELQACFKKEKEA